MSTLPEINPSKMQTPLKLSLTPVVKTMPGAPQKNMGAMYPLPALVVSKLQAQPDVVAKSLDNKFILALSDSYTLALPEGKQLENLTCQMKPEEQSKLDDDWFENQVKYFKMDMLEIEKWR